jgi:hypothetical protein
MQQEVQGQPATITDLVPGARIQLWRWNGSRSAVEAELTVITPPAPEVYSSDRLVVIGQHDSCGTEGCLHFQAFCIDDWAPPGIATGCSGISLLPASVLVAVADVA